MQGTWNIPSARGAEVRLKSGSLGLISAEANAPVRHGSLSIDDSGVILDLVIALEKMRMSNFLMQAAARTMIGMHKVHDLTYRGIGQELNSVTGIARAGDIELPLVLALTITGSQLEFVGSANIGTVHIPLPGMGTIDDFSFDVDATVVLQPK
ncbi:MAG: hypothetical protein RL205_82 [Actinomycetota bacterium]|jgi:hypothetical protein